MRTRGFGTPLSIVGLWILAVVPRPLDAQRVAVAAAMGAGLVILLNLPLAQEFFNVDWTPARPPPAVEVLCRIHARRSQFVSHR